MSSAASRYNWIDALCSGMLPKGNIASGHASLCLHNRTFSDGLAPLPALRCNNGRMSPARQSAFYSVLLATGVACAGEPVDFSRDIRPILVERCYQCHGPDAAHRQAELRLDLPREATSRLPSGNVAVVAGDLPASALWQRVTHSDPEMRMPPQGPPLAPAQQELLKRWIEAGANWPQHWGFVPPRRPTLPALEPSLARWPRNGIDALIARRLVREGLQPSRQADPATLLRRVTLDLTGVPPDLNEQERHLTDHSPDRYERHVDRLLASPRFGERFATDWLDAARYADTHGYHSDSQRDMWRWRQWVIDAFNANMPFDRFTVEQLAGDLLPEPTLEQRVATGFNRNHMLNDENGAIPEEYLCEYVSDRVTTTATVWLGLTIGCARCHDHKYDPVPQRDFYRLYAFFNNVPENGLGGSSGNAPPLVVAPTRLQRIELDQIASRIGQLEQLLADRAAKSAKNQAAWEASALAQAGELKGMPQDAVLHLTLDEAPRERSLPGVRTKGNISFVPGKLGQALLCDGETFVEVPRSFVSAGGLERTDAFTLSLWVFATTGDKTALVSSVDETLAGRGFEVGLAEDRLYFRLTHVPQSNELLVRTAAKVPRNKWRHIAMAYDGGSRATGITIFVDGQPQELETVHETLSGHIATDQPIRIGRGDSETFFRGMLDDVRLFTRSLSFSEAELLAGGNPILELLQISGESRTPAQQSAIQKYFLENEDAEYRRLQSQLMSQKRRQTQLQQTAPTVMVMDELPQPRDTFVLNGGRYDKPGEQVTAGTPELLPPMRIDLPRNRLGLAQWLMSPEQPLTARVTVNRFWQSLFGVGLVKTPDDFGTRGAAPSHAELLDWLALEFQRASVAVPSSDVRGERTEIPGQSSAWNIKRLIRRMVTSATYRQTSRVTPELLARDGGNRLLARGPRKRLGAEAIRDSALAAAGLLDDRLGGPSVRPYQPADLWKELAYNPLEYTAQTYNQSQGGDLYRRGLYTFRKRTVPPPSLALFDAADREVCTVSRNPTNTPLQALVLLNDPTFVEAARHLAQRVVGSSPDDAARLKHLYLLVLARTPRQEESAVLLAQLAQERHSFRAAPEAVSELLAVGESAADSTLDAAELAAWTTIASVVMNLDEAITNR